MTAPDGAPVLRELDDDGVLLLTLHRPERRNAWTLAMEEAYFGHLEAAAGDPAVRVVVVTGAGTSFCPGLDPTVLSELTAGTRYAENRRPQTFSTSVPKPIVAAINGNCAGIGLLQALFCDVRFAVEGARFSTAFSRRGLNAEDGASWLLPRLVGPAVAADLLLSGRTFDAAEALRLGVVNRVEPAGTVLDAALGYARDIARTVSPHAAALIKQQMLLDATSTLEQARVRAQELIVTAKAHPDFREGVTSFVEKRPPRFQGLEAAPGDAGPAPRLGGLL